MRWVFIAGAAAVAAWIAYNRGFIKGRRVGTEEGFTRGYLRSDSEVTARPAP